MSSHSAGASTGKEPHKRADSVCWWTGFSLCSPTDPHQLLHRRSCCLDLPILSDPQLWLLLLSPLTSASPLQVCWVPWTLWGFPGSSAGKESACSAGDPGSIPGSGRSAGDGIGYPLQYSGASLVAQLVKNPLAMWETRVQSLGWEDYLGEGNGSPLQPGEFHGLYGVAKSRTRLSDFHFHGLLDTHHIGSSLLKFLTLG